MIYSGDTKPNWISIDQAKGVDVWAHEIVMPPDQWAASVAGVPLAVVQQQPDWVDSATKIVNSSHTTQAAFGYMLSQIGIDKKDLPRLTVATHFQAQNETIYGRPATPLEPDWIGAKTTIDHYVNPDEAKYIFAADFLVLNVTKDAITQRRADVSRYAFAGGGQTAHQDLNVAKYHDSDNVGDPNAQIDDSDWIPYTGYYGPNDPVTYPEDGKTVE
jgi:hypothetical protein